MSLAEAAHHIPQFARMFDLPCSACHLSPPKLNEAGEAFVRRNYEMPDREGERTIPLAVWASARVDIPEATPEMERSVQSYVNRVEVISGGKIVAPWLSYFVEWRPLSSELRADGSRRDRSGRFEDLFLTGEWGRLELQVGQFRQVEQVDISRRIGVNEPGYFSAGLAGEGGRTDRIRSLRSFSLSGRAPTLRAGWITPVGDGRQEWSSFASVSVPGEISLPLTSEAREEASNELELRPKGVFFESFLREGLDSWGMHAFIGRNDRLMLGGLRTGWYGPLHWTAAAGFTREQGTTFGRGSLEGEYFYNRFLAVGGRLEDRGRADAAFIPYVNTHFPGTRWTLRGTLEHRFQSGRSGTFMEFGVVF